MLTGNNMDTLIRNKVIMGSIVLLAGIVAIGAFFSGLTMTEVREALTLGRAVSPAATQAAVVSTECPPPSPGQTLRVCFPTITGNINDEIEIPITVRSNTNLPIEAYEFNFIYDSAHISLTEVANPEPGDVSSRDIMSVTSDTLSSGTLSFLVEYPPGTYNIPSGSTMRVVSGATATFIPIAVNGTGVLLKIPAKIIRAGQSTLEFVDRTRDANTGDFLAKFRFERGGLGQGEVAETTNGSITTTVTAPPPPGPSTISGRVLYQGSGVPVSGVQVVITSSDNTSKTAITDSAGAYTFSDLEAGPWKLSASKMGDFRSAITSADSAYASQVVSGLQTPIQEQAWACDVSGNGLLATQDATAILNYVVGRSTRFLLGTYLNSDWLFSPNAPTSGGVTPNQPVITDQQRVNGSISLALPLTSPVLIDYNFNAALVGDCNGDWK